MLNTITRPAALSLLFLSLLVSPPGSTDTGTLSIPIIVSQNRGTPCDVGVSLKGPVPAGAIAAGFTHCAANYDFSDPYYATLSNWLSQAGASSPHWYINGYTSWPTANALAPLSDFSIVSDPASGGNVLRIQYTPTDWGNHVWATELDTTKDWGTLDTRFPVTMYIQFKVRLDSSTTPAACYGGATGNPNCFFAAIWNSHLTAPWSGQSELEIDWEEIAANWFTDMQAIDWQHSGGPGYFAAPLGYTDTTKYETIGSRMTSDGATAMAICSYIDGVGKGCSKFTPGNAVEYNIRQGIRISVGPQTQDNYQWPLVPVIFYIQSIQVFTCDSGATTECNGAVLTTP